MEDQLNNFRPNIIGQIIFTQMIGRVFDIDSTKFIVYQNCYIYSLSKRIRIFSRGERIFKTYSESLSTFFCRPN